MNYQEILKTIAVQEQCSPKQIEREMKKALTSVGVTCSPKVFIKQINLQIKKQAVG